MRSYSFITVDVFTDQPFGGNPLAVFPDARGLSGEEMQHIAGEINYSEITFVLPPADPANTARVRIFTPRNEVPFAGHPNLGTGFVLGGLGRARRLADGREVMRFEEAAGPMPGGNTRTVLHFSPFPLGFAKGEGCFVEDLDGHRLRIGSEATDPSGEAARDGTA